MGDGPEDWSEDVDGGGVERNRKEDAKVQRDGRSRMLLVKVFTAVADAVEVEKEEEQRERVFGRSLDGRRLEEPVIMTSSTLKEATTVVGRFTGAEAMREIVFLLSMRAEDADNTTPESQLCREEDDPQEEQEEGCLVEMMDLSPGDRGFEGGISW